eukprot:1610713-Amphidinium_carterae.1
MRSTDCWRNLGRRDRGVLQPLSIQSILALRPRLVATDHPNLDVLDNDTKRQEFARSSKRAPTRMVPNSQRLRGVR